MARSRSPVSSGDLVDLRIDALAHGGTGVARADGFVVFVKRGLPGDLVKARITRVKRSFAEAVAEEVLESGDGRIAAPCPFHTTCGGCAWQALDYPAQLVEKQRQVEEALARIGGIDGLEVQPIVPAVNQFGYRNKVEYSFMALRDDTGPDEFPGVAAGFHALGRWDTIVGVDPCHIADERGVRAQQVVVEWANRHEIYPYDRKYEIGILRNLVVRVGHATGEVLVNLVTGAGKLPKLAELADDLAAEVPGIVGVLHTTVEDSSASNARGDEEPDVLWGRDHFFEELAGVRLKVGSKSFLQTNTAMAEVLYALILKTADPQPDDVLYDLYCGIGSIGLMFSPHVAHVFGVELVQEAIENAAENMELNGVENAEFAVGNVRPILKFTPGKVPDPTVVVVDPPRSGLVQKVVMRICERRPERIVYVSCNPTTFAGNLPWFHEYGYAPTFVQPVDMFPHTPHVELVARLEPIPGWQPPSEN
jgi:23S rRNA (uracil1939-C5)-methyltransferase